MLFDLVLKDAKKFNISGILYNKPGITFAKNHLNTLIENNSISIPETYVYLRHIYSFFIKKLDQFIKNYLNANSSEQEMVRF